ncbi:LysM peptidoglycan-binding domain-containing protein [Streptomyces griseosporeus]|uniref:LysM peptidoglycan-binding domain-containing protein n=1 Tax=Streptomyces griseosporeus TaxID=1910 RepID=UPI0036F8D887
MLGEATGPHEETCTHTVVSGDTLWDIAARNLGDPERWTEIYNANQTVIEAAAREHPAPPVLGTSDHGHWIFPGTTLTIPGANCAPTTTTPTTPPTETAPTTPTGGEVTDQKACEALDRPWVSDPNGDFCGTFVTLSVPPHPFTQAELDEIKRAEDTVGCAKDVAEAIALHTNVLTTAGYAVVKTAFLVDKWVTLVRDAKSGDEELILWDAIGNTNQVPLTSCVKLAYDHVVETGNGATEGGGGGSF